MSFLATAGIFNTKPTGGSSVTPTFLDGGFTDSTTASGSDTITLDLTSHNGTDDIIVVFGGIWGAGVSGGDATLDGNADTAIASTATATNDGAGAGYARFAGTTFATSSDFVLTYSGGLGKDTACAAYAVPSGCTLNTLATDPESGTQSGSTLSGNVSAGDGVIAVQAQCDGGVATWSAGMTKDYEDTFRSGEYLSAASAGNVSPASPMTITTTGTTAKTAGYSIKLTPA